MALLLQHVGLRLPLPHQQLAQVGTTEGNPVPRGVEREGGNGLVRDGEAVDDAGVGQADQQEGAAVKPRHQNFGLLVKVCTCQRHSTAALLHVVSA